MTRNQHTSHETNNIAPPSTLLLEMDGALVNSIPMLYDAYCELLSKYGYKGTKTEFRECLGLSPTDFIPLLSDQCGLKKPLQTLLNEYMQLLRVRYTEEMPLVENVKQFLEMKPLSRLTIGLVANSPLTLAKSFLQTTHLNNRFDALIAFNIDDDDLPSNIYRYALSKLDVDPSETVAVVNAPINAEKCLELGILTILLTPHGRSELVPMSDKRCLRAKNWETIRQFFMLWNDIYQLEYR